MSEVREDAVEKAKRLGLDLIQPKDDEVFVDLDNCDDRSQFQRRIKLAQKLWPNMTVREQVSGSGGDHRHVYITIPELRPIGDHERIAIQAALGSDAFRELLAVFHGRAGYKYTSVFFEKKKEEQ